MSSVPTTAVPDLFGAWLPGGFPLGTLAKAPVELPWGVKKNVHGPAQETHSPFVGHAGHFLGLDHFEVRGSDISVILFSGLDGLRGEERVWPRCFCGPISSVAQSRPFDLLVFPFWSIFGRGTKR